MSTKPCPIHQVLRRIRPLAPFHRAQHLRALIELEPKRSVRRGELESALKDLVTKQIKREVRAGA